MEYQKMNEKVLQIVAMSKHETETTFSQCLYRAMVLEGWTPDFEEECWRVGSEIELPFHIVGCVRYDGLAGEFLPAHSLARLAYNTLKTQGRAK